MVWPLAYSQKKTAINVLINEFVQDDDYQSWRENVKRATGGSVIHKYKLSVSCLEYFIAKKIKPVFEVYRKVFHKAIELQHQLTWQGMPTIYDAGKVY